jgi:hypothetical protein
MKFLKPQANKFSGSMAVNTSKNPNAPAAEIPHLEPE